MTNHRIKSFLSWFIKDGPHGFGSFLLGISAAVALLFSISNNILEKILQIQEAVNEIKMISKETKGAVAELKNLVGRTNIEREAKKIAADIGPTPSLEMAEKTINGIPTKIDNHHSGVFLPADKRKHVVEALKNSSNVQISESILQQALEYKAVIDYGVNTVDKKREGRRP